MFGGFEKRKDADATTRYGIAALVAALLLSSAGAGAVALSDRSEPEKEVVDEIIVDFTAPEKPVVPPPPPPPPPPPTRKVEVAVARPAPSLAPPPPPARIERDPLPRGDAETFVPDSGGGDESGDVAADMTAMDLGGGGGPARPAAAVAKPPPPPPPRPKAAKANDPIVLPDDAVQARPQPGNTVPAYPPDARAAGLEGDVILKIVINADGTVGDIEVKKGEEPFVSAAIAAVETWTYSPAQVDGQPVTAYRVIKVPFRLSN